MTRDELFLETIEDLRDKTSSGRPYDVLRSAGLLRQLLLDKPTLLSIVSKGRIGKVFFKVKNPGPIPGADTWFLADGLDPTTSPPIGVTYTLNLDEFLKVIVIHDGKHSLTIKDVVRYASHILGGVHAGTPDEESDVVLDAMDKEWQLGSRDVPIYTLAAIIRVVLKAIEPLEAQIRVK